MLDDGRIIMYTEDTDEIEQERQPGFVKGNTKYVIMFEKCPALGGVERTHVTLIGNANLRGVVSAFAGTNIMVKFVSSISSLRKKFCRSFEIDAFRRNQIGAMIKSLPPSSESCIASVLFKDLSSMDKKRSATTGWGISSSEVFAHFIDVAAYFWNYDSRHLIQTSGDAVREVHSNLRYPTTLSLEKLACEAGTKIAKDFYSWKSGGFRGPWGRYIHCIYFINFEIR